MEATALDKLKALILAPGWQWSVIFIVCLLLIISIAIAITILRKEKREMARAALNFLECNATNGKWEGMIIPIDPEFLEETDQIKGIYKDPLTNKVYPWDQRAEFLPKDFPFPHIRTVYQLTADGQGNKGFRVINTLFMPSHLQTQLLNENRI